MIIRCGFCGGAYDPDLTGAGGCANCPMHAGKGGCSMTKCPACGYDNPLPPKWIDRIAKFFGGKKSVKQAIPDAPQSGCGCGEESTTSAGKSGCGCGCPSPTSHAKTLAEMKEGESGIVECLKTGDAEALDRMMAMSVYPGMKIRVLQTSPGCVFQVGRSRFAVDKELASIVGVRKG